MESQREKNSENIENDIDFSNKSQSIEDGTASIYEKMEKDEHLFKMRNIKIGKTNISD